MAKGRAKTKVSEKAAPSEIAAGGAASRTAASLPRWTFLTNHSHVLVLLDSEEPPVLRDVAVRVGITERAVQRIIQDLESAGFVQRERVGRRNRYRVRHDQHLRHPIESHRTIGDLIELVQRDA